MNLLSKIKNSNYDYVLIMLLTVFYVMIIVYAESLKHVLINDFLLIIILSCSQ